MNNDNAVDLIEAAVKQGFLGASQAETLKEEALMFPGGNVLSIMVRRGILTPEQVNSLESGEPLVSLDDEVADETDMDFGAAATPPSFEILPSSSTSSVPPQRIPSPVAAKPHTDANSSSSGIHAATGQRPARSVSEALGESRSALLKANPTTSGAVTVGCDQQMRQLLMNGRQRGCSDLHITVGKPPYLRHEGRIFFLDEAPLTAETAERLNLSVLTSDQRAEFQKEKQVDFSFECPGAGRFRANVYLQRTGVEGAYRFIQEEVPTLSSLSLPPVLEKLTQYPQGLNLVTGPGGCGKTSTVAAMLEHINRHRHEHIITVEDPVEYVFEPKSCQVTQREVGTHTESFAHALRTALRQDPDVIMIGELRDLETTSISITAAETGHLVFGTLHTSSAVRTVARILDVYPPSQRAQICLMVAESLRGIISQQLISRADGTGRVCAMEILLVTTGVSQVIKEGKTHQLVSHMQSGRRQGMISMDDALMELVKRGDITEVEAYNRADNKSMFMLKSQL